MKKQILFIFLMLIGTFSINSCSDDDGLKIENYELSSEKKNEFQANLLNQLNIALPEKFNSDVSIVDSKIENIDGVYYLKTFYSNDYVSTSMLSVKDTNNSISNKGPLPFELDGTSCTSNACSGSGGCQPKLNGYCSDCTVGAKDCVRTSTGI